MASTRYPREFLLSELRRVARQLNCIPTRAQFREASEVSAETLVKRFGGWSAALACAGFDPSKLRERFTREDAVAELRRVAEDLGRSPKMAEFAERSDVSASTVRRKLARTWRGAC